MRAKRATAGNLYFPLASFYITPLRFFWCKRQLRCRKRGEWTCDLFFLKFGQSPNFKKNKSHVQKTSFAAEGGVIRTQILNELLILQVINNQNEGFTFFALLCAHTKIKD
jgi:hypothetical protein